MTAKAKRRGRPPGSPNRVQVIERTRTLVIEPLSYSVKDACAVVGIKRTTLYELIGAGRLDARKLGAKTLITAASLKAYIAALPAVARAS